MKFILPKGSTSVILPVFILDSSSTVGAGLGSLDQTSSIVGGYLKRNGTGVALAVDENVTTEGTYEAPSTAAHVRIGTPANMTTGTYELHFHNDLFTTADYVAITLAGASNMAPLLIEIQLTNVDLNDGVRAGLTALPNAAADAAGGLPISDAGALDIDTALGYLDESISGIGGQIDTAQDDLDILTGVDGATLATAQANYAPAIAGDAMTLANDAITAAKFDESTAYPLTSADSGATQIARVGADGDTLETLSDEIAGIDTKLGTPADLGGGATLANNNSDIAGATFSTATDSNEAIRDRGDVAWNTSAASNLTATGIAAEVWNSVATSFNTANTFGEKNQTAVSTSQITLSLLRTTLGLQSDDTMAELAGITDTEPKMGPALQLLHMALRNLGTESNSQRKIYNNAGDAIATAAVDDGTTAPNTYTKGKFA